MEYLEKRPGIEGAEGEERVSRDLKWGDGEEGGEEVEEGRMERAEEKRRWRRMSDSICSCSRRRRLKGSALALFQRERWAVKGEGGGEREGREGEEKGGNVAGVGENASAMREHEYRDPKRRLILIIIIIVTCEIEIDNCERGPDRM